MFAFLSQVRPMLGKSQWIYRMIARPELLIMAPCQQGMKAQKRLAVRLPCKMRIQTIKEDPWVHPALLLVLVLPCGIAVYE